VNELIRRTVEQFNRLIGPKRDAGKGHGKQPFKIVAAHEDMCNRANLTA